MQNTIAAEGFELSSLLALAACGKLIRVAAAHWLQFLVRCGVT